MEADDRVLVAIMNNVCDWAIVREQYWYRIPVSSVKQSVQRHWPPAWLAFYQTKFFGAEAFAVNYYAAVREICEVTRSQLFPDEPVNSKTPKRYYSNPKSFMRMGRDIVNLYQ